MTKVRRTSCCFPGRLPRSVRREAFDASSGWVGCSSTTIRRRPEVAKPLELAGFWLSGFVCVVLAVLKLTAGARWSWWRVSLPLWAVLGHNILYIIVGFVWLSFVGDGAAEETITVRPGDVGRGYQIAALVCFVVFADNVLRRIEGPRGEYVVCEFRPMGADR